MIKYVVIVLLSLVAVPSFSLEIATAQQDEMDAVSRIEAANGEVARLYGEGAYAEAVTLAEETLRTAEAVLGPDHPVTLVSVNNLGLLYQNQGRYGEAEHLYQRALQASERVLGPDHPSTLTSVNNLGLLYQSQGRYGEAEPLYQRTLETREQTLGQDHPDTLISVSSLAFLYQSQGRYSEAEPLFQWALEASERVLGPDHPFTLTSVSNLGVLYRSQGRYGEAEPLYQRALEAKERALGPDHPSTLTSVSNLGFLYQSQGRYGEAEPLYRRALEAIERTLGPDHPSTPTSVNNLGALYQSQGRYGEAESLYLRALEENERVLGADHPSTLTSVNNLGALYESQGRYGETEPLYQRALEASERVLGPDHPDTLISVNNLGVLYERQGRYGEAEPHFLRALEVSERVLGPDHPDTLISVNNLGGLYQSQGRYGEAEPLYLRALEASERTLGPDHPSTLTTVNNLGGLYERQGRYGEAEPLYQRALQASEWTLGPDHPSTLRSVNNMGGLYESQGRYGEAEPLYLRALEASERTLGPDHPSLSVHYSNFGFFLTRHLDQPEMGIFYLKKSVNVLQSIRGNMAELEEETQAAFLAKEVDVYQFLQQLLIEQGRYGEADIVSRMIKEQEFYQYARSGELKDDPRTSTVPFTSVEMAWESQMTDWRAPVDKAALAFEEHDKQRRDRQEAGEAWSEAEQQRWQAANDRVASARETYFAKIDQLQDDIGAMMAEEDNQFRVEIAAFNKEASARFAKEVASHTDVNVAMLNLIAVDDATHLLFITDETIAYEQVSVGPEELYEQIKLVRDTPGIAREPDGETPDSVIKARLQDLYDVLMAPLGPHLEEAGTELLLINAQGSIRYVPFAALHDGEGYLAERLMTVLYNPASGTDFSRKAPAYEFASAFGVTEAHHNFNELPHVAREADFIVPGIDKQGLLQGDMYLDADFTRQRFEGSAGRGEITHVATHYRMSPGTENASSLLLGDGDLLSLREIRVNPAYDKLQDTDLLVLSACETALTDGGVGVEVEGLGNILQNKGVSSVIATLWSVADETTADFMGSFYTSLIEEGLPKAQALTEAQKSMIASVEHSAPFYWAPYILQGNWE